MFKNGLYVQFSSRFCILVATVLAASGILFFFKPDKTNLCIEQIKSSSGHLLWSILENGPQRDYGKDSLTEESYIFAAEVEKTIFQLLLSTGGKLKTITIIPNQCPSTVWRLLRVQESQGTFKYTNSTLLTATVSRFNYTRATERFKRSKVVIDYSSADCSGYDKFIENTKTYNDLLVPVRNNGELELLREFNLFYGIYWIIKFDNHNKYFIFSSPYSHQLDYYKNADFKVLPSQRSFHVLSEEQFKSSKYYSYLSVKTNVADYLDTE